LYPFITKIYHFKAKKEDYSKSIRKIVLLQPLRFCLFLRKIALLKLSDPAFRKIFVFSVRKIAARLTPCKIDKPEGRKFNKGRAYRVQLSYA
jgi:hypothetical protein